MLVFHVARLANVLALGFCAFIFVSGPNLTYGQIRPVRFIPLGDAAGGDFQSAATAVSADGRVVVGTSARAGGSQAFIWDAARGMRGLGHLQRHEHSYASGISDDGRFVVGISGKESTKPFIWAQDAGIQDLQVLAMDAGLDLSGWVLKSASDISANGKTVVGCGINPRGKAEGWIMRLAGEAN